MQKAEKKSSDQPEGLLVGTSLRARREPVVLSWLVYRKLNCYQCKPPNDNVWAKAVGSHVCRHEEAREKPTAGQGETMAGQQGGGSMSGIGAHGRNGSSHIELGHASEKMSSAQRLDRPIICGCNMQNSEQRQQDKSLSVCEMHHRWMEVAEAADAIGGIFFRC